MNRGRIVLFLSVMLAAVIVAVSALLVQEQNDANKPTPIPSATVAVIMQQPTPLPVQAHPLFGQGVNVNDGLPTYICAADAFGSYFTLQQMVMAGIDVQNGFHLGIVPFSLDEMADYDISEEARVAALRSGQWDCLLTTADSIALSSAGVITAVVDESAGADQLWARDVPTINDLRDKRITYSRGSVGEYFVLFTLNVARLNPRFDVTLLPVDSVYEAVETFNRGQADVVSGWEPDIYDAEQSGGEVLLSSEQLRIIIDVIATSTQAVEQRPEVVQAFHNAWFQTLKAQTEDFATAAGQIAAWGHNDWSFVYPESATDDLTAWLGTIAQADLGNNVTVMRNPDALIQRLEIARRVWAASGVSVPQDDVSLLVNPRFALEAGARAELQPAANPINDSFSLGARPDLSQIAPEGGETLGVLPCRRFTFLPESAELTLESRSILDDCVIPIMSSSVGIFLRVKGSSAWPGPAGSYTEQDIYDFALARGQAVVDYLVSQGIDPARFVVEATLPPEERRNTEDPELQALDRYVEMSLITTGR
jgi:ABC-type nitrate/sulfonate/bicarbonate transport system substrate-binding protein